MPADVTDRINKAVARNAIIGASQITVSNIGHTIYLEGTVASCMAMDEAVATAWLAPGVTKVVNHILVV